MDEQVRNILERPFPEEVLKQRQGPNGNKLTYAEIQVYVDRLNEAFNGAWSWELVRREVVEDQVVVEGRLTAAGIAKTGVGGTAITRRRDNGAIVSFADDIKTAEADAMKRSCRLLGMGRELYGGNEVETAPPIQRPRTSAPPRSIAAVVPAPVSRAPVAVVSGPPRATQPAATTAEQASDAAPIRDRLTSKQFGALRSLSRTTGYDEREFKQQVRQRFGVEVAYLNRGQASELIGELLARTNGHGAREAG